MVEMPTHDTAMKANPVAAIAHGNPWTVAGTRLSSRFFLGTSHYPSPQVLSDAVAASGCEVLTVGMRRLQPESGGGNMRDAATREQLVVLSNLESIHAASALPTQ